METLGVPNDDEACGTRRHDGGNKVTTEVMAWRREHEVKMQQRFSNKLYSCMMNKLARYGPSKLKIIKIKMASLQRWVINKTIVIYM